MKSLKKLWWLIALRGLLAIIIGLCAIIWPGLTFIVFLLIAGVYILIEGIVSTILGLVSIGSNKHWLLMLIEGIFGLIIGWVLFTQPGFVAFSAELFIQIFAIWLVISGILRIALSVVVEKGAKKMFLMILSGILAVIVGAIIFTQPISGFVAFVWIIGFFAILTGILYIAFAMSLKEA